MRLLVWASLPARFWSHFEETVDCRLNVGIGAEGIHFICPDEMLIAQGVEQMLQIIFVD